MSTTNPLNSNTDSVKQTDRAANGPQPDNTPASGGGPTGGGGGAPTGPAGGDLTGTYPNPTVLDLSSLRATTYAAIGYAAGGNVQIRFELGSGEVLPLVIAASFSPAGSTGIQLGARQELVLDNVSGAPVGLTFNASWKVAGQALPSSLAIGEKARMILSCKGTNESDVYITFIRNISASSGTVTSVAVAGAALAASPSPIVGAGTITWHDPSVFNVLDYGAVPNVVADYKPQITLAINAARAFASAGGSGATVYFPDGKWYISSELYVNFNFDGAITLKGNGSCASAIVQQTPAAKGINFDFTSGLGSVKRRAAVQGLAVLALAGVDCGDAIKFDFGTSSTSTNHLYIQGCRVEDVFISGDPASTGGWANGLNLQNVWGFQAHNMQIYGGSGWTTGNIGQGINGAGSGSAIVIAGGTNQLFTNVYCQTWSQNIRIIPTDGIGGADLVPQGCIFSLIDSVNVMEFCHAYAASGGSGVDWLTVTNFQIDNGNNSQANHRMFYLQGGGNAAISQGYYLVDGGIDHIKLDGFSTMIADSIKMEGHGAAISGKALWMTGVSNGSIFDKCLFDGQAIQLDAAAGFNQVNNTAGSVVTNTGAANTFSTTIF